MDGWMDGSMDGWMDGWMDVVVWGFKVMDGWNLILREVKIYDQPRPVCCSRG
jgi:hypothetical protein